jgi:hypothetical protein
MMHLRSAMVCIAACAAFPWAIAQNNAKNGAPIGLKASEQAAQCIPANTWSPLPAAIAGTQTDSYGTTRVALGSYERVSPDGRFVLRSFSGGRLGEVSLIELDAIGAPIAAYDTPLSNEAFPVQGTWRYLVDVNGDHYSLSSIIANNSKSKRRIPALFRGGMRGFYAAAAELPFNAASDKPGHVRIRSMSWPNPGGNADTQGEGALVARTIEVDVQRQRITADTGAQRLCGQRLREDGPLYALPMISVDGQEFAALPQTPASGEATMRIYAFGEDGKGCLSRAAFGFSSGKTIFGFPPAVSDAPAPLATPATPAIVAAGADLAYEYRSQIWWVSRGVGTGVSAEVGSGVSMRFNIAPVLSPDYGPGTQLLASAFPGITQDGRVIYGATLKLCSKDKDTGKPCQDVPGYVTSDPYQSNAYQAYLQQHKGPARRQCITHGDVARARTDFAKLHGLVP